MCRKHGVRGSLRPVGVDGLVVVAGVLPGWRLVRVLTIRPVGRMERPDLRGRAWARMRRRR